MEAEVPYRAPHTDNSQIGRRKDTGGNKVLRVPTKDTSNAPEWPTVQPGGVTRAPAKLREVPVPYDWWVEWPHFGALVVFNTTYTPVQPAPEEEPTYIMMDGLWGRRDYSVEPQFFDHLSPHLAFLPVPLVSEDRRHILFRLPSAQEIVESSDTEKRGQLILAHPLRKRIAELLGRISDVAHLGKRWSKKITAENSHLLQEGKKSTRMRLVLEGRFPSSVEANMFDLLKILTTRGAVCKTDLILVWVAMQRCAGANCVRGFLQDLYSEHVGPRAARQ
jgi:hypothetical protein